MIKNKNNKIIAIDIDEVLSELLAKVLERYNGIYKTKFTKENCLTYRWHENFGVGLSEVLDFYQDFVNSGGLKELEIMPGAKEGINELKKNNELAIVTSRALTLRDDTEFWLNKYFPNCFKDILYLIS